MFNIFQYFTGRQSIADALQDNRQLIDFVLFFKEIRNHGCHGIRIFGSCLALYILPDNIVSLIQCIRVVVLIVAAVVGAFYGSSKIRCV